MAPAEAHGNLLAHFPQTRIVENPLLTID